MKKTFLIFVSLLITVSVYSQASWSLTGNAGTTTSNFAGTTDNNPLIFKVNNQWAGFSGYSSKNNVSFGYMSLNPLNSSDYNTAFGAWALFQNTQSCNTAVGFEAGLTNTIGESLTAVGFKALRNNTTGSNNTAQGYNALINNTTGYRNTAGGNSALWFNTTEYENAAFGEQALGSVTNRFGI